MYEYSSVVIITINFKCLAHQFQDMIGAKFDPDHAQYGVVFYPNAGT